MMAKRKKQEKIEISAPKIQTAEFVIRGTAPYVQNKFSAKAREQMRETQEAGPTAKKGKQKTAKDFEAMYKEALHVSKQGWYGIPATGFKAALVSACTMVGFKKTYAKKSFFVLMDGFDRDDGTPLVKITKGKPYHVEHLVRVGQGKADIHARAMWDIGWEATVRIEFDVDQFTIKDIANLLMRAGIQVGIGEGRPDSRNSVGMDWGTFELKGEKNAGRKSKKRA